MNSRIVRSCLCVLLLACVLPTVRAQDKVAPISLDLQVYNAVMVLMKFPIQSPHIVIADTTLNSGCGEESGNPVLMNGCGLFGPPSTAGEVGDLVEKSMPQMAQITWRNFVRQSASSVKLQDSFQSPWPHEVSNLNVPGSGSWKSPDGVILFSKVGFSADRKQALVYVLFLSYMKNVPTSGNFFLFQSTMAGQWEPIGRVAYMETQ
jgi:hypothetical protein